MPSPLLSRLQPALVGGTSVELCGEVEGMLELMRATRSSLASRLSRSQEVCAETISRLTNLATNGRRQQKQGGEPAGAGAPALSRR